MVVVIESRITCFISCVDHVDKLRRVWIPMVALLHRNERVLLESGRFGWIVNSARVNEPRTMHLPKGRLEWTTQS
jgi:hypothetical protein